MGKMATREAYGRTLQEIGADERVVVFGPCRFHEYGKI